MDAYDSYEYTVEEARVDALGTYSEQIRFLAAMVQERHGRIPAAYPAVGRLLNKFTFRAVLLSIKTAANLNNDNIFGKLHYSCNAYYNTELARRNLESQISTVERNKNLVDAIRWINLKEEVAKNPDEVLSSLLLDGKITPEQYRECVDSKDKAYMLVEEVSKRERT